MYNEYDADDSRTDVPGWVRLCGRTAPLAAIVVFLAPLPTIQRIVMKSTVGDLPLLPYSSMVASCFLWCTYGVLKNEPRVWFTNAVGLLLGLVYCYHFVQFSPRKSVTLPGSVAQHMRGVGFVALGTLFLVVTPMPNILPNPTELIGKLSVLFCVALFGSPLAAVRVVLQTRSASSIPLPFTMATILNCWLWSISGLLDMKDPYIYAPNLLGCFFGLVQVGLKLAFTTSGMEAGSVGVSKVELLADEDPKQPSLPPPSEPTTEGGDTGETTGPGTLV